MGSGSRWVLYTPRQFSSFRCKFCQNPDVPSKNNGFLLMPLWGKNPEKMHASQFFRKTPHSGDLRSRAPSESSAKPHVHNQICNGNLESHTAAEDSPNLQPGKTSQQWEPLKPMFTFMSSSIVVVVISVVVTLVLVLVSLLVFRVCVAGAPSFNHNFIFKSSPEHFPSRWQQLVEEG